MNLNTTEQKRTLFEIVRKTVVLFAIDVDQFENNKTENLESWTR